MRKNIRKFVLPGTTLAVSLYFSSLFTFGMLAGYMGTNTFLKRFVKTGRVNPLILNWKSWEIHLHHWILGILVFFAIYFAGLLSSLPIFLIGTLGGLILHDLHTDDAWHKVVYKKK